MSVSATNKNKIETWYDFEGALVFFAQIFSIYCKKLELEIDFSKPVSCAQYLKSKIKYLKPGKCSQLTV